MLLYNNEKNTHMRYQVKYLTSLLTELLLHVLLTLTRQCHEIMTVPLDECHEIVTRASFNQRRVSGIRDNVTVWCLIMNKLMRTLFLPVLSLTSSL